MALPSEDSHHPFVTLTEVYTIHHQGGSDLGFEQDREVRLALTAIQIAGLGSQAGADCDTNSYSGQGS